MIGFCAQKISELPRDHVKLKEGVEVFCFELHLSNSSVHFSGLRFQILIFKSVFPKY